MNIKRGVVVGIVIIVGIPVVLVLGGIAWYLSSDRTNGAITVAGEVRDYLLYVPQGYDPAMPVPLVISMHGTALWPGIHKSISRWNSLADTHGFIVVYPGAAGRPERKWRLQETAVPGAHAEVQFISELIDRLEDEYAIDASRIYADGLSAGGSVAILLACRMPDRVAAIGTVMAPHVVDEWCDDPEPVPLIAFNGTADPLLPYEGGTSWAIDVPMQSVRDWIARWAMRNQCARPPRETRESEHVFRGDYESCAEDLVHYTLEGGGHQWPGGLSLPEFVAGPAIDTMDATGALWRFFSKQRLQD